MDKSTISNSIQITHTKYLRYKNEVYTNEIKEKSALIVCIRFLVMFSAICSNWYVNLKHASS